MESSPRHAAHLLLIALVIVVLTSRPALSWEMIDDRHRDHQVSTGDGFAEIGMSLVSVGGEVRFRAGREPAKQGDCQTQVTRIPPLEGIPIANEWFEGAIDVRITCGPDNRNMDLWVAVPDADDAARDLARDYVERVLAPEVGIGTSPPANVLVGLPTWFWLDGWDGTTRTTTVTAPWGDTLDLHLTVDHIEWDFGDGTPARTGGVGQAHPAESDIQHTYTHASTTRRDPDATYPLSARITIGVAYHYDTHGPIAVDPIELTVDHPIQVGQLQAVLSR